MTRPHALTLLGAIFATGVTPASARAYNYASALAKGCHESITIAALRAARAELELAAALPTRDDDRAFIDDLPLDLPKDVRDLGGASLIVGVRDNDLKGRHGLDTAELALVHGDPDAQDEHCLRRAEHDEPDGSREALAECRAYIAGRFADAVQVGLDASGTPDPDVRTKVAVYLTFVGKQHVPMPRFHVQLGRALHALQDSFSHTVRSPDGLRVRSLLNWIDFVEEHHIEARDGATHRAALDECEELDPLRQRRLELAIEASEALLRAALDPALEEPQKLAAADAVLDRYMSYEAGCGADNAFCDAPELEYPAPWTGCSAVPGGKSSGYAAAGALALAGGALRARRSPREAAPRRRASTPDSGSAFALAAKGSLSIDETAAGLALGGRYRASERWAFGIDGEWNPWASIETSRLRPGTFNAYGSAVFRAPVAHGMALRVTGRLGASWLLFDLYGAPAGSVGPYFGLSLLALELELSRRAALVLEPADVVVTMPHVSGIPLTHRQYRASVAFELQL